MKTRIPVVALGGIFSMAVFWGCATPNRQLGTTKPTRSMNAAKSEPRQERTETRQCPPLPVLVMSNDVVVREANMSMLYVNTKTPPRLIVDKSLQTKEPYIINVFEITPDNQCVLQKDTCIPMSVSIKTTDMRMSIDRVYDTIVGIVWNFKEAGMVFTTDETTHVTQDPNAKIPFAPADYITDKRNAQIRFTRDGVVLDGIKKKQ